MRTHVSRRLRFDLPHRVEQLGLPVQVVTALHAQRAAVDAIHGAAQSRE